MQWRKRPDRFKRSQQWHLWFAWHPVVIKYADESEEWIWLRWLACRLTNTPGWCPYGLQLVGCVWEYIIPVRTDHGTIKLPSN